MKKLLTIAATLLLVSTASAEVLLKCDFEDGTQGKWEPWQGKSDSVKIVEGNKAKDSQYAMSYRTGVFTSFFKVKAGVKYKVSFDSNLQWGKTAGFVMIQFYNKDKQKLEELAKVEIPATQGYKPIEFTFDGKMPTMHRITFAPGGNGGEFIVDNIKIEEIK